MSNEREASRQTDDFQYISAAVQAINGLCVFQGPIYCILDVIARTHRDACLEKTDMFIGTLSIVPEVYMY